MRVFLAGIMQGSHQTATMHSQAYRQELRALVERHLPAAQVYDPWADHGESLGYDEARGRSVFFHHNRLCREVDVVIAVLPEASMGTGIEIWEAHQAGRVVLTISPLVHNWAVKFLSTAIYADLPSFAEALAQGHVAALLAERRLLSQHLPPPYEVHAMAENSLLTIDGAVDSPRQFTAAELAALSPTSQVADVGVVVPGKRGSAVRLPALLQLVRPRAEADYLTLHAGSDDFHASIPLAAVRETGLVVYQLDGAPLEPRMGGPFRFLIPDHAACRTAEIDECANVKFIDRIELSVGRGHDNRPHDDEAHAALHQGDP